MANLTLPITGVSGVGAVGTTVPDVNGGTTSKALLGNAGVGALGSVGSGVAVALTGVSGTGHVGASITTDSQPFRQEADFPFPLFGLALTGTTGAIAEVIFDWPAPALAFTGLVGADGALSLTPPSLALQIAGTTGVIGSLALVLPTPAVVFSSGNTLNLRFPKATLALTALTGNAGALKLDLPSWSAQFGGVAEALGAVVLPFPTLRVAVTGLSGGGGQLQLALKALALTLGGATGTIGTLALRLPIVQLDVAGFGVASGSLELLLPIMDLRLAGVAPLVQAGATTLVMQTERGALTQYSNYPFNSFAAFNGTFLGASDAGVFALTGDTDAGAAIAAAARGGTTDFGTSHVKRIERIYVGYRSSGRMILRVVTDELKTRDYAIAPVTYPGLHGAHVRLGRGLEARYWQFETRNVEGSSFSLDMYEMKPIKLPRRVGGASA